MQGHNKLTYVTKYPATSMIKDDSSIIVGRTPIRTVHAYLDTSNGCVLSLCKIR